MSNSTVAKRYASALFQIAKEQDMLGSIEEELRVVKEVFEYNSELKALLKSSRVPNAKKKEIIRTAFGSVSAYVLNTLMILVDRHRVNEITEVVNQFIELSNDEQGIAEADVYSVRPLSDAEREALSATFAAKVGKKSLRIENFVDSNLLGGVKLRIGNRIYDGTLSGKLVRLERKLLS
jgi:F-type H+-transporting ATPase subunit delta